MAISGKPARQIVEEKGLIQISDTAAIEDIIVRVLTDNPTQVEAFRNGKTKLLGFFVGQVMKETRGKANPKVVNEILKRKLETK
jgi:aspartyl-tRNA(Asn)/glutamyl-tRNA(Gln) amidotransferase subunit B